MREKGKLLITVSLVCILLSSYASAANDTFNEYTEDSHFIASRGTFADTIDQDWKNSIVDCWANITGPSYHKFDKSIKSIGSGSNNEFLVVYIGSTYKGEVNDSRIDQMYQKIESYCEENVGINNVPVVFMWAEDEDDLILVYDPDAFENAKGSSNFVASRGNVPTFSDEDERLQWSDDIFDAGPVKGLDSYFAYYDGPLLSYSFKRYSGYIEVGVNKETPEKVNDSSINEIYQIFFDHYEEVGISDIPVVFVWTEPGVEDIGVLDETPSKDDDSENKSVPNNKKSAQSTPGFTSIMLVLCLLILVKYRK